MRYLAICASVLALSACDAPSGSGADAAASASPPVDVSAGDLSKAFQENEAKAKLAYDGKSLRVTGKVKDIALNFMDEPEIKLRGSGDVQGMGLSNDGKITDVVASGLSKEQAAEIKKGQMLTVVCAKVDEVMGSAQLSDCKPEG